jgi:hypothetical protein
LEDEIYAGKEWLENLRKRFPTQHIVFLYGNHEDRLDRYVVQNSKIFWNFLKLENMLDLKGLNIEFYHYNYCYQLEKTNLYIQHSPPSYGVSGTRTSLLKKMDASFIYGCTHRKQMSCMTGHSGNVYTVYFNGWLGNVNKNKESKRVFSYAKGHENWQPAACFVDVLNEKQFFVTQLDIHNYKFVFDGFLYEG